MPGPSFQNWAAAVWEAVLVVLFARPSEATCERAWSYVELPRLGGAAGRKAEPLEISKGVTFANWGSMAGAKSGGVGRQSPGTLDGGKFTTVFEPSFARSASVWLATSRPSASPAEIDGDLVNPATAAL